MKKVLSRYSAQDAELILKTISEYPTNLRHGFKIAGTKLNRNPNNIAAYYYQTLKKKNNIITVGSNNGFSKDNIKNQHKCKKTGAVIPDLQPIQYIIKDILNLSLKERNFLAMFLTNPDKLMV